MEKNKNKFPIKGWKKMIVYIVGLLGVFNLAFWIYQYFYYLYEDLGDIFFNERFHKGVYYWGILTIVILVLAIILGMIV